MKNEAAWAWLNGRAKFNIRPGLDRIQALLDLLGHPEQMTPMIHIAGTNGKGSTIAFAREILQAQGLTVGTFTSPAIEKFTEQIAINGTAIPDDLLINYLERLRPLVEMLDHDELTAGATVFELTTAIAFLYFAESKLDVAIIEVGLGGLEDSTNVITPLLAVITTIGLDHVNVLGNSLAEIAQHKAGIIKPGVPVVTGRIEPVAMAVIAAKSAQEGATLYQWQSDYQVTVMANEHFAFSDGGNTFPDLYKGLVGVHQIDNAAVAIELVLVYAKLTGITITSDIIQRGLANVSWPARMEEVQINPLVILDGAHNVPAISRLVENIQTRYATRPITIIFSAIVTKDIETMLAMLAKLPDVNLILTSFDDNRAMKLTDYRAWEGEHVHLDEDWPRLIEALLQAKSTDEVTIITGSLYFISQVRQRFYVKEE